MSKPARFSAVMAALCGGASGLLGAGQQSGPASGHSETAFHWPDGKRAAVSLNFDDARLSQVDTGLAALRQAGVKATFFVLPSQVEKRLSGWKQAVADGHEIANHSLTHPCTGNYPGFLENPLENYTPQRMAYELDHANERIQSLLGVHPRAFAYPCGLKFVGRGLDVQSYVPLVAERFLVGRGYLDESSNNPAFCDLAQAMGTAFDDTDFAHMKKIVDQALQDGRWVIFVGHEMGKRGFQVTDIDALLALCQYTKDPAKGVWLGTVQEIGSYIHAQRRKTTDARRDQ